MNVSEMTPQSTTPSSSSPPPPGHNYSSPIRGALSISPNTATTPPLPAGVFCSPPTACCTPSECCSGRRTGWTKRSGRRCLRTKTGCDQVNLKKRTHLQFGNKENTSVNMQKNEWTPAQV